MTDIMHILAHVMGDAYWCEDDGIDGKNGINSVDHISDLDNRQGLDEDICAVCYTRAIDTV